MSLFIHPENQKILWNVISSSPQFQMVPQKEIWFKDIIQDFYNKTSHIQINAEGLQILNKETIVYMLERMNNLSNGSGAGSGSGPNTPSYQFQPVQPVQQQPPHVFQPNMQQPQQPMYQQPQQQPMYQQPNSNANISYKLEPTTNVSRDYLSGQKQDFLAQQYKQKQNEYESMRSREAPKDVNFRDAPLDTPISNMDELIKNHLRERDAELQKFAPPPPAYMAQNNAADSYKLVQLPTPPVQQQSNRPPAILKIDQTPMDNSPIIENIVEFVNTDAPNLLMSNENKKVHWTPPELSLTQFKTEIEALRIEIKEEVRNEIQAEFAKMREMIGTLQAPLLIASQQLHEYRNQIVSSNTITPLDPST